MAYADDMEDFTALYKLEGQKITPNDEYSLFMTESNNFVHYDFLSNLFLADNMTVTYR